MHAILVTLGTDGDVFPYVGLGAALRARGHRVTLVASAQYKALADAHGLEFRALVSVEENDALFGHPDFWQQRKTARLQVRWGLPRLQKQYELLSKLITDDGLLVAPPPLLAVGLAHEKCGAPLVSLLLQPWIVRSSTAPPLVAGLLPLRHAPPLVWKLVWRTLDAAGDIFIGRHVNRLRASLGLIPAKGLFRNWMSRDLVLGLFPDWYGERQSDWPPQLRMMGFPRFDCGPGGDAAPQLVEFCRAGDPPVAFTFGTGMAHSAHLFQESLDACALAGKRGVFLTKFRDQLPKPLPQSVIHSAYAPFKKLFPLCAAVVHHGGVGTVAEAIAAGVPQLIRPICFDQMDNGDRVRRLGVGDWLRPGKTDARRMADALPALLTSEAQLRCRELSVRLKGANALQDAADAIDQFAAKKLTIRYQG